jgi:hypothetical protein
VTLDPPRGARWRRPVRAHIDADEDWTDYLRRVARLRTGDGLPPGYVPWSDLYAVVGGIVVGRVSVRHRLTEDLAPMGGHVGFGVQPGFRWDRRWQLDVRDGTSVNREGAVESILFEVRPDRSYAFAKGGPFGQTRYQF